jgi:PAS domain S-box-containing protein
MKRYDTLPLPISFASGEANGAFRALTGNCGTWQDSLHADDRERVEAIVEQGRSSGQAVRFEARLRDRDGVWQTLAADGVAVDASTYILTWREVASEAAARFIAFMDHVPAVASLKDSEGRYLWVNRAFEAYTGFTIDELRGKTSGEWMPAEAAAESLAMALQVVATGQTHQSVSAIRGANGRERTFINTLFPVAGPSVAVGMVATDITQLTEHERALVDRAQRQHVVAELGREILLGLSDHFMTACEDVTRILGTVLTAIFEFDRPKNEAAVTAADGPAAATRGMRLSLEEGRCQWMLVQHEPAVTPDFDLETRFPIWEPARQAGAKSALSVPIPGDFGPYGFLVTYGALPRDYTREDVEFLESIAHLLSAAIYRKLADREIASQRQELEALINHAPDLITRYDRDLTLLFVNDVARLSGWDPEKMTGLRVTDLGLTPEIESAWVSGIRSVFETGKPHEFETPTKDGRFILDVRLVPELDETRRVARVLGISRDVTERRKADEERAQLQETLEQTRRATSVSRLGTTVAHEFNNVLMSISPFAEIIARTAKDDPRLLKAATHIRSAIVRGRHVTQDIMRYTRPATPAPRSLDLAAWLPHIVQNTMQTSSVPLTLDVAASPVYAAADPQQLEQAVTNLLLNAREAMADGGAGGIRVRLTADETNAQISVADDGPGISSENLDKLFDPFFTTKRAGTGLGLPVARQIVERHHGTIDVRTGNGHGTVFVITLPLPAASNAGQGPAVEETIRGRRLLLVEDEPAVSDGLIALLEAGSAEVRVAATGKSALIELEAELPEAVLLDVGLPDIDGVELFAVVRGRWPRLPIIFSTGHGDQARLDEMLRLPHVGHLVKPYDLDELTAAVANAIAR